jgi:hypothetical protein
MPETPERVRIYTIPTSSVQTFFATGAAVLLVLALGALPAAGASAVAAGRVTARIDLPSTRLRSASTVKGRLVLTNSGDLPVDLNQGCTPKWEVVLGKGPKPPGVAFTLECGVEPFVVPPGTTRLPFGLRVGRRRPGRYRAFLVASDPSFPHAKPVKVTVVSAK